MTMYHIPQRVDTINSYKKGYMMQGSEFIVIDIVGIPRGLDIEAWLQLKMNGIIIWDSSNYEGQLPYEPKVFNAEHTYRTIDISMLNKDERDELLKSIEE